MPCETFAKREEAKEKGGITHNDCQIVSVVGLMTVMSGSGLNAIEQGLIKGWNGQGVRHN